MAKKKSKSKLAPRRGRPEGVTTETIEPVIAVKPACRRCKHDEFVESSSVTLLR